jgi:hypothetical protein
VPPKLVRVDAYGQSPVSIIGYTTIDSHRRFSDDINTNQETITLQDAEYLYLDGVSAISQKIGEAKTAILHKHNIVLISREPETEEEKDFRPYMPKTLERAQVNLMAGNWVISGVVYVSPRQPVSQAITPTTNGLLFLPVTSAKTIFGPNPRIELPNTVDVLLINRSWITSILVQ